MSPNEVQLFSTKFSNLLMTLYRCVLHPFCRSFIRSLGAFLSIHIHHSLLNHCLPVIVFCWVQLSQDNLIPEFVMTQRLPSFVDQKKLVEYIEIDDHYILAPKEEIPPSLVCSHPVVDAILIPELVSDGNVIHFAVVFIFEIQM